MWSHGRRWAWSADAAIPELGCLARGGILVPARDGISCLIQCAYEMVYLQAARQPSATQRMLLLDKPYPSSGILLRPAISCQQ